MAQVFHDRCKVGNAIPLLQEGSAGRTSKPEWPQLSSDLVPG